MAKSRSSLAVAHRPNPLKGKLAKANERLAALGKRAKAGLMEQEEAAISVGVPAVLGFFEGRGTALPTVMNIDPALLYGAALSFAGMKLLKGKNGRRVMAAGVGLLASAGRDSAKRGSIKIGEEEIAGEDYEAAGDDDDLTSGEDDDS